MNITLTDLIQKPSVTLSNDRMSGIVQAINSLVVSLNDNDKVTALYSAKTLMTLGIGFPLFSIGRNIAKHLVKSLYYHADMVTVHDSDVQVLKNVLD